MPHQLVSIQVLLSTKRMILITLVEIVHAQLAKILQVLV